jgi:hypothetical protein
MFFFLLCVSLTATYSTAKQQYESLGESVFSKYTALWLNTHHSWVGLSSLPEQTGCGVGQFPIFSVCVDGQRLDSYGSTNEGTSNNSASTSNSFSDRSDSSNVITDVISSLRSNMSSMNSNSCPIVHCVPNSLCISTPSDTFDYNPPPEDLYRRWVFIYSYMYIYIIYACMYVCVFIHTYSLCISTPSDTFDYNPPSEDLYRR